MPSRTSRPVNVASTWRASVTVRGGEFGYGLMAATVTPSRAGGSDGTGKPITVEAGRVLDVDLELAREGVTVALVLGPRGGEFGYGLMAATEAPVTPLPRTVTEARQVLATFTGLEVREGMIVQDHQIELSPVRPGHQLACASPLRGNPKEPGVIAEMQQNVADWPITCRNVQIAPGVPRQEVVIDVPPLPPR